VDGLVDRHRAQGEEAADDDHDDRQDAAQHEACDRGADPRRGPCVACGIARRAALLALAEHDDNAASRTA
jgi:hypothetical protein